MSVSSESEPPYNEFYDKHEESDGDSEEGFIDHTVKKVQRKNRTTPHRRDLTDGASPSFLVGLLAPFEGCCFSKGPPGSALRHMPPHHAGSSSRLTGPFSEFVLQTYELPEESGGLSGDSSSGDEIAMGATAKSYTQKKQGKTNDASVATLREKVEAENNIKWKYVSSTVSLDETAKWTVTLPLLTAIDLGLLQLSNDQKRLGALYWCRAVTLSQRMTVRLLEKIVSVARWELPVEMTVEQALKKREEFGTLEFQQIIEARLIEEIMGEFERQATADDPSGTFLVISKMRTVATVARRQGDALLITVFDFGFSKERGPALLGFDKVETAEKFLIDLYTGDMMVAKSPGKFSAWTIKNKQFGKALRYEDLKAKGIAAPGEEVKPAWDSEQAEHFDDVTEDAQHQARVAYTAMYKAADAPMEAEKIFTQTGAGELQVKDKKKR